MNDFAALWSCQRTFISPKVEFSQRLKEIIEILYVNFFIQDDLSLVSVNKVGEKLRVSKFVLNKRNAKDGKLFRSYNAVPIPVVYKMQFQVSIITIILVL